MNKRFDGRLDDSTRHYSPSDRTRPDRVVRTWVADFPTDKSAQSAP